jgi:hypothetical protein
MPSEDLSELEKDLLRIILDKTEFTFTRAEALKILQQIKIDRMKAKAKEN